MSSLLATDARAVNQNLIHHLLGTLMVCHYLEEWGCPQGLVDDIAAPLDHFIESELDIETSYPALPSRCLLLALAWLTGHCRLFERELERLQPNFEQLIMLPPFPEVDAPLRAAAAAAASSIAAGPLASA